MLIPLFAHQTINESKRLCFLIFWWHFILQWNIFPFAKQKRRFNTGSRFHRFRNVLGTVQQCDATAKSILRPRDNVELCQYTEWIPFWLKIRETSSHVLVSLAVCWQTFKKLLWSHLMIHSSSSTGAATGARRAFLARYLSLASSTASPTLRLANFTLAASSFPTVWSFFPDFLLSESLLFEGLFVSIVFLVSLDSDFSPFLSESLDLERGLLWDFPAGREPEGDLRRRCSRPLRSLDLLLDLLCRFAPGLFRLCSEWVLSCLVGERDLNLRGDRDLDRDLFEDFDRSPDLDLRRKSLLVFSSRLLTSFFLSLQNHKSNPRNDNDKPNDVKFSSQALTGTSCERLLLPFLSDDALLQPN